MDITIITRPFSSTMDINRLSKHCLRFITCLKLAFRISRAKSHSVLQKQKKLFFNWGGGGGSEGNFKQGWVKSILRYLKISFRISISKSHSSKTKKKSKSEANSPPLASSLISTRAVRV